ncbi:hypothetical protein [Undibacterium sp. RuRC25W]|uniref:hypothetical protein n=1 Tax=Undibacterium sp. RuRC25W TaxID=3413047 RepID=UPI003BEF6C55
MLSYVYDKTEKGREEIATRKHQLANRLRTLLVMVDGKQNAIQLLNKLASIGLNETNFRELINLELITAVTPPEAPPKKATTDNEMLTVAPDIDIGNPLNNLDLAEEEIEKLRTEQFQLLYHFYNETIKSNLGLRGFTLQLKVERTKNIDDLKALRQPYLEAVLKSKGREIARGLRDKLDLLFYESDKARYDSLTRITTLDDE